MKVRPDCKVTVAEWLDGSIHILYENREIPYEEITNKVLEAAKKESKLMIFNQYSKGDISTLV